VAVNGNEPYNITMKHIDLFSGYGGFTIPAQKYGIETIAFSEIDKYASSVLAFNFPNIKNYGDITKIDFKQFHGKVDLITGGSPCQDLSVAGKQAGLSGARSGLFFDYIRAIKDAQPSYFIWENVRGALSSNGGWDFARVQIEMAQVGYSVQWVVYNAKDFGVPQNRERIFAIGTRNGCRREILPEPRKSEQAINKIVNTGHDGTNVFSTDGIAVTQKALGGGQGAKTGLYAIDLSTKEVKTTENVRAIQARYHKGYSSRGAETSGVLVREATKTGYALANEGDSINYSVPTSKTRRGRVGKGVAQTIDTGVQQGVLVYDDYNSKVRDDGNIGSITTNIGNQAPRNGTKLIENMRIRRLTPTECERLMGLQDGEKCGIIRVWQNQVNSSQTSKISASAEESNGKKVTLVGNVEKIGSEENALSVDKALLSRNQNTKKLVVLNVQVNSEKNSIKIWLNNKKEESLLNANGVEKRKGFPSQSQIADFVRAIAGLNTILWKEIHSGKVGLQVKGQPLIHQENGVPVLNIFGRGIMPPAKDAEKDITTLNQHLKSIISLDSKTKNYGQSIQTLFSCAIPVITGFIPTKIGTENISEIRLSVFSGWTSKGIIDNKEVEISDTQRYKMCGNGVVVNVVDFIYSRLFNGNPNSKI
jgi:DNA (cytosine-5)-methyltransferase 1